MQTAHTFNTAAVRKATAEMTAENAYAADRATRLIATADRGLWRDGVAEMVRMYLEGDPLNDDEEAVSDVIHDHTIECESCWGIHTEDDATIRYSDAHDATICDTCEGKMDWDGPPMTVADQRREFGTWAI